MVFIKNIANKNPKLQKNNFKIQNFLKEQFC